jgi:RNA polymerase sigma factor (sigma-70 family)
MIPAAMNREETLPKIDDLLLPFLHAADEGEAQQQLERLMTASAEPILRSIAWRKLQSPVDGAGSPVQGVEDVCGEAVVQLLARLQNLRSNPAARPIADFRAYVAVTAYNACHWHLRQKYPLRHRLRSKIRYLLTHHSQFALWENEIGDLCCGFARWAGKKSCSEGVTRIRQLRENEKAFERSSLAGLDLQSVSLAELLTATFESVRAAIEIDELVNAIADWSGLREAITKSYVDEAGADSADELVDTRPSLDVEVEQRMYLEQLWSEICLLPPRQRAALLLNLKDAGGADCVTLFPIAAVATIWQIAGALGISAEEFAEMWNDLPMDDSSIARRLGITRQQVINLRKSARERLARRMAAIERGG